MKIRIITIAITFSHFVIYSQTSIIAIKANNAIVVGVDTRFFSSPIINGIKYKRYDTGCKIFGINNTCFAISGFDYEGTIGVAKSSIIKSKTIENLGKMFVPEEIKELKKFLKKNRDSNYLYYKDAYEFIKKGVSIVFVKFENSTSKIISFSFKIRSKINEPLRIDTSSMRSLNNDHNVIFLYGHVEAISDDLKTYEGRVFDAITEQIEIQHKHTPDFVATPISAVLLQPDGIKFVKNPCNCKCENCNIIQ